MRNTRGIIEELNFRIQNDINYFQGKIPERNVIAWRAYLAGILEWGVISIGDYDSLLALLPPVNDDPAVAILLGRE